METVETVETVEASVEASVGGGAGGGRHVGDAGGAGGRRAADDAEVGQVGEEDVDLSDGFGHAALVPHLHQKHSRNTQVSLRRWK